MSHIDKDSTPKERKVFVDFIEKNQFYDIHNLVGRDEVKEMCKGEEWLPPFLQLRSGRPMTSTQSWNPLTYALMFGFSDLMTYFLKNMNNYDLDKCLMVKDCFSNDEDNSDQDAFASNFNKIGVNNPR